MNIYLDDNITDAQLVALLRRAGHTVVLPLDVGNSGATDPRHFTYALRQSLVLMTMNHDDFEELHDLVVAAGGTHSGVITIRQDNDPRRDMTLKTIAGAIGKLERSGLPLTNQVYVLNHWR
jgi:predicted nuclease of predicted toxin-antitoxin system